MSFYKGAKFVQGSNASFFAVLRNLNRRLLFVDKRVEDWFLMQTYTPTLLLVVAYLVSIWLGKKLMANREAFQVKGVMFAYNVFLVILNAHIVYEVGGQRKTGMMPSFFQC